MIHLGYRLAFNYLKAKRLVDAIDVCHKVLLCSLTHFFSILFYFYRTSNSYIVWARLIIIVEVRDIESVTNSRVGPS